MNSHETDHCLPYTASGKNRETASSLCLSCFLREREHSKHVLFRSIKISFEKKRLDLTISGKQSN